MRSDSAACMVVSAMARNQSCESIEKRETVVAWFVCTRACRWCAIWRVSESGGGAEGFELAEVRDATQTRRERRKHCETRSDSSTHASPARCTIAVAAVRCQQSVNRQRAATEGESLQPVAVAEARTVQTAAGAMTPRHMLEPHVALTFRPALDAATATAPLALRARAASTKQKKH